MNTGFVNENSDWCIKFECENMRDDVCRFDDGIVENACILCDLYCKCDRCKHKTTCTLRKT